MCTHLHTYKNKKEPVFVTIYSYANNIFSRYARCCCSFGASIFVCKRIFFLKYKTNNTKIETRSGMHVHVLMLVSIYVCWFACNNYKMKWMRWVLPKYENALFLHNSARFSFFFFVFCAKLCIAGAVICMRCSWKSLLFYFLCVQWESEI